MNRIVSTVPAKACTRQIDSDDARRQCDCNQCIEDLVKKEFAGGHIHIKRIENTDLEPCES